MSELSFDFDWVNPEGVNGPELSATWASLTIRAGDSVITRILDDRAKTVRDFVHVPLYPLAEWLVTNWWFLAGEYQNPDKEHAADFRRRHALSTGREGYAYPDLEVISSGSRTRLRWRAGALKWARVEFLDDGQESVDSVQFKHECSELIDGVVRRLTALGIDGTLLEEEWDAIQGADEAESMFCETAAGLGWDPYAMGDSERESVLLLADELGDLLDEAVQAMGNTDPLAEASAIASAIDEARLSGPRLGSLRPYYEEFGRETVGELMPWDTGYRWARRLRQRLDLDGQPLPSMDVLADALGEGQALLDEANQPLSSLAKVPLVDGVVAWNDDESASFALRQSGEQGRRFNFCRAIAEVLASHGTGALITKARSERQRRNRAFAAEFLAPASGLKQTVLGPVVDGEEVDELAEAFGVSSWVIQHQIANHGIAQLSERTVN